MGKVNGKKQALDMLNALPQGEREKLLKVMAKKDPELTEHLKENLVTFEDLIHLTPKMLAELLKEVKAEDFGLGLRISTEELKSFVLNNVSSGMRKDIESTLLGPPIPVSKIEEAIQKIMTIVKTKIDCGQLIINPNGDEFV